MLLIHCLLPFFGCFSGVFGCSQVQYSSYTDITSKSALITTSSDTLQSDSGSMKNDSLKEDIIKTRLKVHFNLIICQYFFSPSLIFCYLTDRPTDSLLRESERAMANETFSGDGLTCITRDFKSAQRSKITKCR